MKAKLFGVIFYTFMTIFLWLFSHELTHGQIFHYFGCENVSYGIDWDSVYTKCNDVDRTSYESEALAHSINEVIGYNVIPMLMFLGVVVWLK